ncbi:MAG: hypothetical protein EA425_13825 [Puniceicoccaceae bacterium]|nr:MAG: hypothetical protein EA425_13825 [Puniceicoccaceae bacterium]
MIEAALWFLGGRGFLLCAGVCLVAFICLIIWPRARWLRRSADAGAVAAILLFATATPVPRFWLGALVLVLAGAVVLVRRQGIRVTTVRSVGLVGLAVAATVLVLELRWWPAPVVADPVEGVVVIGDSLSAGISPRETTWPALLAEATALPVVNRARPGARIADGLGQLGETDPEGRLVIILLGGNDMLLGGSARHYHDHLEALVMEIQRRQGRPFIIDFPALPLRAGFGRATRGVAARHRVPLLHHRHLAAIIAATDGTVDGLHLSPSGHQALAETIARILRTPPQPEP